MDKSTLYFLGAISCTAIAIPLCVAGDAKNSLPFHLASVVFTVFGLYCLFAQFRHSLKEGQELHDKTLRDMQTNHENNMRELRELGEKLREDDGESWKNR